MFKIYMKGQKHARFPVNLELYLHCCAIVAIIGLCGSQLQETNDRVHALHHRVKIAEKGQLVTGGNAAVLISAHLSSPAMAGVPVHQGYLLPG